MSDENSSSQILLSLALFVASAALSRWCQPAERGRQRYRGGRGRHHYRMRRRKSRLSPDNSQRARSLFYQHTMSTTELEDDHEDAASERMNGHGGRFERHEPGETGFYPKNRNGKHLEQCNEHAVQDGLAVPYDSENDDDDSSSSVSDEIVWASSSKRRTNHHHFHRENGLGSWTNIRHSRLGAISAFRQLTEDVPSSDSSDDVSSNDAGSGEHEDEMRKLEEFSYAGDEADALMQSRNRSYHSQFSSGSLLSTVAFDEEERSSSRSTPDLVDMEKPPRDKSPEVAAYNASILPAKVIMIRHGQSEGNVNESLYATTPDNAMRITKLGWDQAHMAGQALKEKILASGESVHFIVSPYVRAVETFHGIVSAWCDPSEFNHIEDRDERIKAWYGRLLEMGLTWHEDPRIREQDFGNYQDPAIIKKCKRERHRFGVFFYRFPHGESASDVFDRVSTFLDSLWRSFDLHKSRNYVLVTHGISIRVFLARYFRYSIDQFSMLANPKNCEMVILGHDGQGKLRLQGRCEVELGAKKGDSNEKEVVGYRLHKQLRVLPKSATRKVKIRVSPND